MNSFLYSLCVIACIVFPYLLGSLNFSIIVSKYMYHDDIRNYGSGNAGLTNMYRIYGIYSCGGCVKTGNFGSYRFAFTWRKRCIYRRNLLYNRAYSACILSFSGRKGCSDHRNNGTYIRPVDVPFAVCSFRIGSTDIPIHFTRLNYGGVCLSGACILQVYCKLRKAAVASFPDFCCVYMFVVICHASKEYRAYIKQPGEPFFL